MKLAVIIAVAILLLCRCLPASAGAVQIGLLNDQQFDAWNCGGPVPVSHSQSGSRCENAAFGETSGCDTVVITNDSSDEVKVALQVRGPGFKEPSDVTLLPGIFFMCGPHVDARTVDESCESLAPGHSCDQRIEFSPEQSGSSEGRIEVRVTGSGQPLTRTFNLIGATD